MSKYTIYKNTVEWFETLYRGEINDKILIIDTMSSNIDVIQIDRKIKEKYNLILIKGFYEKEVLKENKNIIIIHDFTNYAHYLPQNRTYLFDNFLMVEFSFQIDNIKDFNKHINSLQYIQNEKNNIIKLYNPSEYIDNIINLYNFEEKKKKEIIDSIFNQGNILFYKSLFKNERNINMMYSNNCTFAINSLIEIDLDLFKKENLLSAKFLNFLYKLWTLDYTKSSTAIGILHKNLLGIKSQTFKNTKYYKKGNLLIDPDKYLDGIKVYNLNKKDSLVHIKKTMAKEILKKNIQSLSYDKLSEILELSRTIIKNIDKKLKKGQCHEY